MKCSPDSNWENERRWQKPPSLSNRGIIKRLPFLIVLFSNRDFQNGMQAAAFCGLIPKEYQSGTSIEGKPRMTKRGPGYIRAGLRMAATAVLVTKKPNPLKEYYERLVESGKAKASALGALMHKLVIVAFAIWRDKVEYQYGNP